ncbi:MAG: MerR family transcriptional regulator [Alphaproteobacteria bacterium]|nr:MerR family transcriptional regulator [Alphaproteobacteria bacterium]
MRAEVGRSLRRGPRHPWREVTQANTPAVSRRAGKSGAAYRTTGEVSEELDLPAHVLRFWESKFPEIKPLKRGGGRRYYRPEDVDLLRQIRHFLYQEGYTIRGVQKLLREGGPRGKEAPGRPVEKDAPATLFPLDPVADLPSAAVAPIPSRQALQTALEEVRRELLEIRALLNKLLA